MNVVSSGFVSLVGAGPGDAELITVRGLKRLQQADLVLYDALVHPELLALAGGAQRFFVGKRAGRKSMKQQTIHRLMIRAARRGKRVVRLKCGDPFMFGRGGEEALALSEAGIPFEVVPGISTALAAPALSNVPVTHRGMSSALLVVSGHAPTAWEEPLGAVPANGLTIVVMMGLNARAQIASHLLASGWREETPAAIFRAAGTPDAHTWTGSLRDLRDAATDGPSDEAPGTLCIGEVVQVRHLLQTSHDASLLANAG